MQFNGKVEEETNQCVLFTKQGAKQKQNKQEDNNDGTAGVYSLWPPLVATSPCLSITPLSLL